MTPCPLPAKRPATPRSESLLAVLTVTLCALTLSAQHRLLSEPTFLSRPTAAVTAGPLDPGVVARPAPSPKAEPALARWQPQGQLGWVWRSDSAVPRAEVVQALAQASGTRLHGEVAVLLTLPKLPAGGLQAATLAEAWTLLLPAQLRYALACTGPQHCSLWLGDAPQAAPGERMPGPVAPGVPMADPEGLFPDRPARAPLPAEPNSDL